MYSVGKYYGRIIAIFTLGDNTISLIANVQDNFIFFYIDDLSLYDFSISDCFYGIFQHLFKT